MINLAAGTPFKPMTDIFKTVVDAIISTPNSKLTSDNCSIDFFAESNDGTKVD
jgi:hypothetical protein